MSSFYFLSACGSDCPLVCVGLIGNVCVWDPQSPSQPYTQHRVTRASSVFRSGREERRLRISINCQSSSVFGVWLLLFICWIGLRSLRSLGWYFQTLNSKNVLRLRTEGEKKPCHCEDWRVTFVIWLDPLDISIMAGPTWCPEDDRMFQLWN